MSIYFEIPEGQMIEGVFEVGSGANIRELAPGKYAILPDPNAPAGGWTPFNADGEIDSERLAAEGWAVLGTMQEE
ncbi:hypothetical protein PBI_MIAZEAL_131 [Mycobacterium phage MiaZeal]|uniref:hypothetical protein n=1 Tax=Mycobacterium phage MiaZeal TaxID=1567005 RepID=UPI000540EA5F|nr:hypothetical protein AVV70_gp131 [Mycobacterium phage MiaZeal]AIY32485.1 hypothetical protein PBI_MIAZEAL_131 [Mycobacterium phage MiaZeal]